MDILPLLDELQIIARNGLHYAQNPYDRERYERLMELTARHYGEALDLPPAAVRERLSKELGYVTPKVGADAAIFNPAGEILLVLRADDQCWCLPCGWVEPYESPAEGIAEKFHMAQSFLEALNPGADFSRAGAEIIVAVSGKDEEGGGPARHVTPRAKNQSYDIARGPAPPCGVTGLTSRRAAVPARRAALP